MGSDVECDLTDLEGRVCRWRRHRYLKATVRPATCCWRRRDVEMSIVNVLMKLKRIIVTSWNRASRPATFAFDRCRI